MAIPHACHEKVATIRKEHLEVQTEHEHSLARLRSDLAQKNTELERLSEAAQRNAAALQKERDDALRSLHTERTEQARLKAERNSLSELLALVRGERDDTAGRLESFQARARTERDALAQKLAHTEAALKEARAAEAEATHRLGMDGTGAPLSAVRNKRRKAPRFGVVAIPLPPSHQRATPPCPNTCRCGRGGERGA